VRIVSLLPSATEIVFALGRGNDLVGVSFECDHPPEARTKPIVSGTALPTDAALSATEIDAAVRERLAAGEPIYTLDRERIRAARPDVILAQDLCEVCAVPSGAVEEALDVLGCRAEVLSLDPERLDDVIACVERVGATVGREHEARELAERLRSRVDAVRALVGGRPRPAVLALEWSDPPFDAGHWVPDMIDAGGGRPVLATAGARSRELTWEEIGAVDASPLVVLFMPCGYGLDATVAEGRELVERPELVAADAVWAVAGDAYFSRPGPRVVDGVELVARILHPEVAGVPDAADAVRLR
jgi:iron complex transport system substrate-binding protein